MNLATIVFLGAVGSVPFGQAPSPLTLFTFSRDSAAGFEDVLLDTFRRELGRHVESFTRLAYSREEALVAVQLLGPGDLQMEIPGDGRAVRYLFRSDERAGRIWALVHVAGFSKDFSAEGSGGRDLSRLAKSIADWIRANSAAIRDAPSSADRRGGFSRDLRR